MERKGRWPVNQQEHPFADLPAALVDEVISQATAAGESVLNELHRTRADRERLRDALMKNDLVIHDSQLGYPPLPTTCATDGSYAIDRLLTIDLAAAAAVAMEGLSPPTETRHWAEPRHSTFVVVEPHHAETATVLRAVMLGKELLLAVKAPHDLVMLDGTLTLPIIYFNQALNLAPRAPGLQCSKEFLNNAADYLEAYASILSAERSDQQYISLSKYSTRREVGRRVGWDEGYDDRGLLTLLLQPGELTRPLPLEQPDQPWHLNIDRLSPALRERVEPTTAKIVERLSTVHVFYYRPHPWLPALRVEAAAAVTTNMHRLAVVVQGLKHQCATPSILEPFPAYLADRMVKAVARALPSFRQVAVQKVAETYEGKIDEVFFSMHGYRTESGGSP